MVIEEKLLVKPERAAEMTDLCRATIYKLIANGEIPSIRIGSSRRVPVEALRQWIADKAAEAAS